MWGLERFETFERIEPYAITGSIVFTLENSHLDRR